MAEATNEGGQRGKGGRSVWDILRGKPAVAVAETGVKEANQALEASLCSIPKEGRRVVDRGVADLSKNLTSIYSDGEEAKKVAGRIKVALAKRIEMGAWSIQPVVENAFDCVVGLVNRVGNIVTVDRARKELWLTTSPYVVFLSESRSGQATKTTGTVSETSNAGGSLRTDSHATSRQVRIEGGQINPSMENVVFEMVGFNPEASWGDFGSGSPTVAERASYLAKRIEPTGIKGIYFVSENAHRALVAGREAEIRSDKFHLEKTVVDSHQEHIRGTL